MSRNEPIGIDPRAGRRVADSRGREFMVGGAAAEQWPDSTADQVNPTPIAVETEQPLLSADTMFKKLDRVLYIMSQDDDPTTTARLQDEFNSLLKRNRAKLDTTTLPDEPLVSDYYTFEVMIMTKTGRNSRYVRMRIEIAKAYQASGGIIFVEDKADDFSGRLFGQLE